jgi:hypothetical protein
VGSGLPRQGWGFFNRHYGDFCTGADKKRGIPLWPYACSPANSAKNGGEHVAETMSSMSAADGEEMPNRYGSMLLREVCLEGLNTDLPWVRVLLKSFLLASLHQSQFIQIPIPEAADVPVEQGSVHARQDRTDLRRATRADDSNRVTGF